jgi:hypothetical protein
VADSERYKRCNQTQNKYESHREHALRIAG